MKHWCLFGLLSLINCVGHSEKRVDVVVGPLETSIVGNQLLIKLNVHINLVAVTHIAFLTAHICATATERLA